LAMNLGLAVPFPTLIEGVFFQPDAFEIDEDMPDIHGVTFQDCYFEEVQIDAANTQYIPTFKECVIQRLLGKPSMAELPSGRFIKTEINDFETVANTNASIRAVARLTAGEKVLL